MSVRARLLLTSVLSSIVCVSTSEATPRLAATYGQDCQLCHVNPTGGGMRNDYVTSFIGPAELPLKPVSAHEQTRWPKAKLNEQISVGTDLRLLYLASDDAETNLGNLDNTFLQMQADFYVAFAPDPSFVLYLDRGTGSDYEVFALARLLPAHGYLKGGRFVPDIGWRWDDHTRYAREKLNLDFPGATETGLEVGVAPGPFSLTAGVYNGNDGALIDDNPQKMFTARVLYRWRVNRLHAAIGGSTRWNSGTAARERLWGVQAEAGWGSLAYIGDFFGQRVEDRLGVESIGRRWIWIMSQELDYRPLRGLDVFVGYDFSDPDMDHESGTQYQLSLGSRVYLRHFFKIEPVFRFERDKTGPSAVDDKRLEVILHAFY